MMMVVVAARRAAGWSRGSSSTLEVLQRLASGGSDQPIRVRQDTPQPGESPIYYVQLPSSPYYYVDDSALASVPLPPHTKVDIDFSINGKPWARCTTTAPPPPSSTTFHYHSTTYPCHPPQHPRRPRPRLPPLSSTTIAPAPTESPSPDATPEKPLKRSKVTLKKKFSFNGKPTKVYVWRGSSPLTIKNHRRARRPFRF
ncbi:ecdysone-inducible protein E75-like [Scylla paramamosain]|uniref:ecdysone-inducible protein E75-like n=1 Tax=Scylla paramamosain TaxID=85552 RepID=UPI003082B923